MKIDILLTVIIPTKNREIYAKKAVEQILGLHDNRVQVVIQDNGNTRILEEMLHEYLDDKRLKYNYTKGILSFVDNFNLAVELADGEYLCLIGDDDGITSQLPDVVQFAKEHNIDAIKASLNAIYFWPNSYVKQRKSDTGYLYISKMRTYAEVCYPFNSVEKLMCQGAQRYLDLDLVKLYHGVVSKKSLDNIKSLTGKYFGGLTPDIYISVALSLTVKKMIKVDFPLTISGICSQSGSADAATGRHTGKLEDAPHFRGHERYLWSSRVPRFYSVETIWADSALAAIQDLKPELLSLFNVAELSKVCIIKYPQYKKLILNHFDEFSKSIGEPYKKIRFNKGVYILSDLLKRVVNRLKNKRIKVDNVQDIIEANRYVQMRMSETDISLTNIINALNKTI